MDMLLLVKAVREALDTYGNLIPYNFTLTVAGPAPFGYQYMYLAEIGQYVDFWNLMAYDYTTPWSNITSDQANLFYSSDNPASTLFDTE